MSYSPADSTLSLDRTNCTDFISDAEFTNHFATVMKTHIGMVDGKLKLHIFVDKASVEIFVNDGRGVMSATTFPSDAQTGVELFSNGGKSDIVSLEAWKLRSIWNKNR